MLTIYDSHHIPTNRCLPGHRACLTYTGSSPGSGEARRVQREIIALINRRLRFAWLVGQWNSRKKMTKSQKEGSCR